MATKALLTGITGQDGSYLAEFLLDKGYEVHGIRRRVSVFNTERIDHLEGRITLHHGDMTDTPSLMNVLSKVSPQEVYHLAAQSHVHVSFEEPEYTAQADAIGTLRMLESIRLLGLKCKFYNASTSEIFGSSPPPQNEQTPFHPRSPYGCAKLYSHWITRNYREAYGMWNCNGILFNHESPRRGQTFVTRKISVGLNKIKHGKLGRLYLGNLEAKRDWGHAKDFVEAMWLMMSQSDPDDYVIATGRSHSVRDFVDEACRVLDMDVKWWGDRLIWNGKVILEQSNAYKRPSEVDFLKGDASKARGRLGWFPKISFRELVQEMVEHDARAISPSLA